jgi:3'-phosphoadenosine 5'-phosphosulfate sulfotransferase (PAPS reductase)/FAD synthetase
VWNFLLATKVPYCSLYDRGYTSIGSTATTVPNDLLRRSDGSFAHARLLADPRQVMGPLSVTLHNPGRIAQHLSFLTRSVRAAGARGAGQTHQQRSADGRVSADALRGNLDCRRRAAIGEGERGRVKPLLNVAT